MKGTVKIIRDGTLYEEASNMILDGMGVTLADAQMISPSLSAMPSASALLDTSNYTIQAISFGKNAKGFYNHVHNTPDSVSAQTVADHIVRVKIPTSYTTSSYITSDVTIYHRDRDLGRGLTVAAGEAYKLLPEFSNPVQTRLEQKFYGLPVDTTNEVGHNLNKLDVSGSITNRELYGCYPDASGTKYYLLSSWDNLNTPIGHRAGLHELSGGASGIVSSTFNITSSMDRDGFVKMTGSSADLTSANFSGLATWGDSNFSSTGRLQYGVVVSGGDLLFAGLFGGIYTLGLWTIDIKETIKNGISAPFPFNHLDNQIKYRLVARKTFTRDLTFIQDYSTSSGYKYLENPEYWSGGCCSNGRDNNHLLIQWEIDF